MPLGPLLTVGGATLIAIGCLLPWFVLRADLTRFGGAGARSRSVGGLDTSDGTLFLVIGIGIGVLGALALVMPAQGTRLGLSAAAALGALFVGALALYEALTPTSRAVDEIMKEVGSGSGFARRFIEQLFDRGFITIHAAFGLWLVVIGAIVALVGSILAAIAARSADPVPSGPAIAGAPASGWAPGVPAPTAAGAPVPGTTPPESPPGPVVEDRDPPPGP